MTSNNGNVLRLAGVVTIIVGVFYFIGNSIIKNDDKRIFEDRRLEEKFNGLQQTSNDCLHKIDIRLGRIEDKLGVKR